jgi:hypothetical protein
LFTLTSCDDVDDASVRVRVRERERVDAADCGLATLRLRFAGDATVA